MHFDALDMNPYIEAISSLYPWKEPTCIYRRSSQIVDNKNIYTHFVLFEIIIVQGAMS